MARRDPKDTWNALFRLAGSQAGYFTAGQALSVGYTYRQQHFHAARGNWLRIDHGVYRLPEAASSRHEDLVRWTLWTRDRSGRPRGIVSHDSALAVHEFCDVDPPLVHLTVPQGFRPRPAGGARLHRASLAPEDIEEREGFRVTTPLRTLRDAAEAAVTPELLAAAVAGALERAAVLRSELLALELHAAAARRMRTAIDAGSAA